MLGSESSQTLPPFAKNPVATTTLAPFKSSLAKNPHYFSLARSPEIAQEKKILKEENWKLKQMMHNLNEENLKLKQKLSQKTDVNRQFLNEGIQFLNQNRYIEVLQESLRSLKMELGKKKQENIELRKKMYKYNEDKVIDGHKIVSSRNSLGTTEKIRLEKPSDKDSQEQAISELQKTINYLKNEIKTLQEENLSLEDSLVKNKETVQKLESLLKRNRNFSLITQSTFSITGESPKMPESAGILGRPDEIIKQDDERLLKRENLKNEQANLLRFLRNFYIQIEKKHLRLFNIVEYIRFSEKDLNLDLFCEAIKHFQLKLPLNEIEESFLTMNKEQVLDKDQFIKALIKYEDDLDSSKSSDISSGSSAGSQVTARKKAYSSVNTLFDNISLTLKENGLTKEIIETTCLHQLPDEVTLPILTKFFYDFASFISDPSDKTFTAINLMEGFETKQRNEVIEKMIQSFFKHENINQPDSSTIDKIIKNISLKEQDIMTRFKEFDAIEINTLSWECIVEILLDFQVIKPEEIEDFKVYCYDLGHSLKNIPYAKLCSSDLESSSSKPTIKALVHKRTSLKN
ncbi:hypothetical protein SteCoe_10792 [Stentor coeruleus]|uniref:Uncharacterized protein n=1 Tax=Stentor coeruleus TaxID=5963 RepID=A0A1R2CEM6_9CILI|nr:hypothetical protein SteCoe_10792 [Stentor coeruleus]